MKLIRYGFSGDEKPGLVDRDGVIRDLSGRIKDISGEWLDPEALAALSLLDVHLLPKVYGSPRINPCVSGVGKLICIGLNYSDHAVEAGIAVPPEPVIFMKATSSIVGPYDDIVIPRGSQKVDWEVELGVVIGRKAKCVAESAALDHVAGYCVVNDVSERSYQLERSGQWTKGKSCDTFGPIGPWLVTKDEVPDPQALKLWLSVNGQIRQKGTTAAMICSASFLVSYLSRFMTLHPGDVIATGTPAGVGMGSKPQRFLKAGDVVELGIERLGAQRQTVTSAE